MDNDYNRALSGYSQQLQELGGYAEQKTAQIGQYNSQVKSAVSSYKKLAEGKTTNEFLSALAREGSAAGIRYLKQQLVKTDEAGKLTGKLGQGVGKIDKFLGKGEGKLQTAGKDIGNLGRRLAGKAEEAGGTEATELTGEAEGIYGAYEGGKGIYDFVKDDILGKGVEAAKESVAKVQSAITNVGNSIAIPTFDTAMNIHSSGAW